jgi:ubiquinone/menaquinone biosynthesis C-methylase UbiE
MSQESLQRDYYASTAQAYDSMHVDVQDEHSFALAILAALVKFHGYESVLDIGSGTGRALLELESLCPGLHCVGVEPVEELRKVGHAKGVSPENLIDGRGDALDFADNSFDVVTEFAVLHHVPKSRAVIKEMCRVARKMLIISDCNFVGQGGLLVRCLKRVLFGLGLWPLVTWIKTGGKGFSISEEDGISYSYSVFQDIGYLRKFWKRIYTIPTHGESGDDGSSLLFASHCMIVCSDKI